MGQQLKFVATHNLTDDTFYTLALSLLTSDSRTTVNDKMPWEFNHGGVWSPSLYNGLSPLYFNSTDYYTDPLNPLFITTSDSPTYTEYYTRTYMLKYDITTTKWEGTSCARASGSVQRSRGPRDGLPGHRA